jgi:SAM-dependent methyltransferase
VSVDRLGTSICRGLDRSLAVVRSFNRQAAAEGFPPRQCLADRGAAEALPYSDRAFDAVLMLEVLEHVPNVDRALAEVHRVLKPGGRCCIAVPTYWSERFFGRLHPRWFQSSGHLHVFPRRTLLDKLTTAGLQPVEIKTKNSAWTLFWLLHSLWQSDFDFTGMPTENHELTRVFWGIWRRLCRLRVASTLEWIGDRAFPKSLYVYCQKLHWDDGQFY